MTDASGAENEDCRPLLLTLPPSHYCERARWALDLQGIVYDEERLAPGTHLLRVKRLGAEATSLPLLLLEDGSLCQGSDRILDWVGLPGGDPEIERRLEQETAPLIRQCLYAGLLSDPRSGIRDVLLRGTSKRDATIGRLTWPLLRRIMAAGMNARPRLLPDLIAQVEHELDWFDRLLAERGAHLAGREFGRADLTAASLLAPVALPQVEPVKSLSAGIRWPRSLAPFLARWSDRPSLKWVRHVYEAHRVPL
ncbi:MAG: glutathione S-transferase N-terminal domain-containing protein [Sphingomonadales bacterium]|nr:glutathione S-transferase N-terminal domain-containing protein [Sphingomonadales bacterium]MDE2170190.1 glutathione S-transferase N-terminal domain-containing protein [Sphingomonadales bacterium]